MLSCSREPRLELPLLYYPDREDQAAHANKATDILTFVAPLPPVRMSRGRCIGALIWTTLSLFRADNRQ